MRTRKNNIYLYVPRIIVHVCIIGFWPNNWFTVPIARNQIWIVFNYGTENNKFWFTNAVGALLQMYLCAPIESVGMCVINEIIKCGVEWNDYRVEILRYFLCKLLCKQSAGTHTLVCVDFYSTRSITVYGISVEYDRTNVIARRTRLLTTERVPAKRYNNMLYLPRERLHNIFIEKITEKKSKLEKKNNNSIRKL